MSRNLRMRSGENPLINPRHRADLDLDEYEDDTTELDSYMAAGYQLLMEGEEGDGEGFLYDASAKLDNLNIENVMVGARGQIYLLVENVFFGIGGVLATDPRIRPKA